MEKTLSKAMRSRCLYEVSAAHRGRENFQVLLRGKHFLLERIVSFGQRTPPGEWLTQRRDEWVILLRGSATLLFPKKRALAMKPGDHLLIPAGMPHRVERTHPRMPTVWLALHTPARAKDKAAK